MATTIDELLVGLGFEYDPEELEEFKSGVDSTISTIKTFAKVAAAGAAALTAMVTTSSAATDNTGKLANEIGETTEEVESLAFALGIAGGESGGMETSLRNLSKISSEAARGIGGGVEAFGILGLQVTDANGKIKSSSRLIMETSAAMQGLSKQRQIELADKLGLGDSIRLLQQGPKEIRRLQEEAIALGVTTEDDAKAAAEWQDSMVEVWAIVKSVTRSLSTALIPTLNELTDTVKEWWINNRQIIEQRLPEWIERAKAGLKLLTIAAGFFIATKLVGNVLLLVKAVKSLSLAALILNGTVLAIPALITLAIAALVLFAQDLIVFLEGGDSLIGRLLGKFPELERAVEPIQIMFGFLADTTSLIIDGWVQLVGLIKEFTAYVSDLDFGRKIDEIKKSIEEFGEKFNPIESIRTISESTLGFDFGDKIDEIKSSISGFNPISEISGLIDIDPLSFIGLGSAEAALPVTGITNQSVVNQRSEGSRSTRIEKIEFNIDGSTNPEATANAINEKFIEASQDFNSPVVQ